MMLLSDLSLEEMRELHNRSFGTVSHNLSQLCALRGYALRVLSRDIVNIRRQTFFSLEATTPFGKVQVFSSEGMEEMTVGGVSLHQINDMFTRQLVDTIVRSVCSAECDGGVILGVMSVMEANRKVIMELIARSVHES